MDSCLESWSRASLVGWTIPTVPGPSSKRLDFLVCNIVLLAKRHRGIMSESNVPNREEASDSPCRQSQNAGCLSYINTGLSCWCFCFKNTQREVTASYAGKAWSPTVWLSPFYVSDCRPHQLDCGIYLVQQKGSIVHTDNLILYSINEFMLWGMLTVKQPWTLLLHVGHLQQRSFTSQRCPIFFIYIHISQRKQEKILVIFMFSLFSLEIKGEMQPWRWGY